jgi:FkbM family methyltransferase
MGLFDRWLTSGRKPAIESKVNLSEQEVARLIGEGQSHEAHGRVLEAVQCYLAAIPLAANPARAYLNYGNALLTTGKFEDAMDAYDNALKHDPDYSGAYYNRGNALLGNGAPEAAIINYRRALEIKPDYAEVHCTLGVAFQALGQFEDSQISLRRALELNPKFTEALFNLGMTLKLLARPEEALSCFRQAAVINPEFTAAHSAADKILKSLKQVETLYNLAITLQQSGQLESAADHFRQVLEIKSNFVEALYNLGLVLQEQGQPENAITYYRKVLEIKPDSAESQFRLGLALQDLGRFDDAVACYRRALALQPNFVVAHNNLGLVLQELGQLDLALACYRRALELDPDFTDARNNLLLILNYFPDTRPPTFVEEARKFGQVVAKKVTARLSSWKCSSSPERLRVGLVSGDLRTHSVGYFIAGLLPHIDLTLIELIAYPTYLKEDELTSRIKPYFSAWKPLSGMSDEAAARLIHADGVHVLVDLSGHTSHNRLSLFAWKPAPVQVTWLGLPNTTGVQEMDYVLGDAIATPPETAGQFTEKIWRLPDCYVCFSAPHHSLEVVSLPALATGRVTFGSFNNLTKMNDAVVELWARVLLAVPGSRLYLKTSQLNDTGMRELTLRRFAVWGIKPERLLLGGTQGSIVDHLAEYHKVDIALDTFPYTGTTTTVEALWMGVPVLSLQGDRFMSLSAKSIATYAGLADWVALDRDDYIAKAAAFSADLTRLSALRAGLRRQVLASPVFDSPRFARNFESALRDMWLTWSSTHAETASQGGINSSNTNLTAISLANGLRVTVPASLQHMTTFVLNEQLDWFEDEINFVRHFVRPGMHAIDIGANFGLYALNIAKIIGDSGKLWAFEPAEYTASCLTDSLSDNEFNNIVLVQAGLSDRCGEAKLYISSNSELNSLSPTATGSEQFESIELLTLDSCREKFKWDRIAFIKMDAEGEELNILKGGAAFLSSASPLIMYELMHGQETVSLALAKKFQELGYINYRLLPALNILIPFDQGQPFDDSLLNLFCCKEDCAIRLEQDGFLIRNLEYKSGHSGMFATEYFNDCEFADSLRTVTNPFKSSGSENYAEILECYLASRSIRLSSSDRVAYLMSALRGALRAVDSGEQSIVRLITYARIAIDAGERSLGVKILGSLVNRYHPKFDFEINEWFLPAAERYDAIDPNGNIQDWLMSSVIEQFIIKHAFSAYFTGQAILPLFERLQSLGFMDSTMQKRHEFVRSAFSAA